jgi:hypothetical protein
MHVALLVKLACCPLPRLVIILVIIIHVFHGFDGDTMDKMKIKPSKEMLPEKLPDSLLDTFHLRHTLRKIFGDKIEIRCQVHM